jgi:translocation and assembly module TamA
MLARPAIALEQVTFQVAGGEAAAELRESLQAASVLGALEGKAEARPAEVVAAAKADYARLLEVLYAQGYYSVVVNILIDGREAALIDPFEEPSRVTNARILVEPGRLFRFGKVQIAPRVGTGRLPLGFRAGAPALATVAREATQEAVLDWRKAGHAKAEIADQVITARHNAALLDVDVAVAPGPRVRFGNVKVTGKTSVRQSRVRQIAGIPSGEMFTPEAVEKAAKRLRKVGTFRSVQVSEAEEVAPDGTMDMNIAVVDAKPRRVGAGIDYSNFDGLTLSGYWLHRILFGGAERFRIGGEISQIGGAGSGIDYSLSARAEKPAVYGPDTLFFAEAKLASVDEPDYREEKFTLDLGVSRLFSDRLTGDLGIGYSYSRVTDLYVTPNTTRRLQMFRLPLALTYDSRDDPLDAKRGVYLRGDVTPFYETYQSQSGAHLTFDGRAYRALGQSEKTVLAGRVQLGALVGPSAQNAPPGFLFYSGGGGTVRGQPYKSLGANYGGVTLGGRSFAALSGEVRFPLRGKFGMVAFADAGFVSGGFFSNGNWQAGAGLGLRYKTPVGPIRLDVAGPVAGNTGGGVQVYVGIGQAF